MKKMVAASAVLLAGALFLAGCSGPSAEEEMYNALEKAVAAESSFEDQQEPLVELEKKENELYEEIISLGMKEYEKIVSLSEEALSVVEEREKRAEDEKESIMDSKEEFKAVEGISKNLDDQALKSKASDLQTLMQQRYDAYDALSAAYNEAIALDKELYQLFQKKDLKLEELEAKITEINSSYEKVAALNKEFNDLTEKYNKAKMDFYKKAEIEVEQSDDKGKTS